MFVLQFSNPAHYTHLFSTPTHYTHLFSNPAHYTHLFKPRPLHTPLLEKSQTQRRYWGSWNVWVSSFALLLVRKWEWHRRKAASLQRGRCGPPAQTKQKNKSSHSLMQPDSVMQPDYVSGSLAVQDQVKPCVRGGHIVSLHQEHRQTKWNQRELIES